MTSETKLTASIVSDDDTPAPVQEVTDLRNAAFVRIEEGRVVSVRRSISSILLIGLFDRQLEVVGLLHPDPVMPLDYRQFGDIPFLRARWPVEGNTVETEWVIGDPSPPTFWHTVVALQQAELTGGTT